MIEEMVPERIAVIGANLAGARAAEALRQLGFTGELLLVGEEVMRPYERPPLSKQALLDEAAQPQWVHAESFYGEKGIELVTGCRVTALRRLMPRYFELELSDGRTRTVDTVLLTTGGSPRELVGCPAGGTVHYVRSWADSVRLRNSLAAGVRVVVIGSGFIGAEVASTALKRGCNVTLIEATRRLFPSIPSQAVGDAMASRYADAGVLAMVGVAVAGISEGAEGPCVHLSDGTEIHADVVVAGIGVELRVELARMVGADVGRGVLVNQQFCTSVPGLYAAGDVCTIVDENGSQVHTEHWKAAQEQGAAAAHSILSIPLPQLAPPWCWSDQLGQRIEVAGTPRPSDEQVVRRLSDNELCVFHLRQERLIGIVSMNAARPMRMAMKLLDRAARPDKTQLADSGVPLNQVAELV